MVGPEVRTDAVSSPEKTHNCAAYNKHPGIFYRISDICLQLKDKLKVEIICHEEWLLFLKGSVRCLMSDFSGFFSHEKGKALKGKIWIIVAFGASASVNKRATF